MTTPEEIAAAYGASEPTTQRLIAALVDAQTQATAIEDAPPWPHGSGTADDPFVTPPGFSLDMTAEQWQAQQEKAT